MSRTPKPKPKPKPKLKLKPRPRPKPHSKPKQKPNPNPNPNPKPEPKPGCARCEHEPELVRCFVCPACGEGPASPVHSGGACRTLACTECGATSVLDEEAWAPLAAAEASDDMNPKPKLSLTLTLTLTLARRRTT